MRMNFVDPKGKVQAQDANVSPSRPAYVCLPSDGRQRYCCIESPTAFKAVHVTKETLALEPANTRKIVKSGMHSGDINRLAMKTV
jgi:hypothetical protein